MANGHMNNRLVRRLLWVAQRTSPFEYVDFEVELECTHDTARRFLTDLVEQGLVRVVRPGKRHQRALFASMFTLRMREQGEETTLVMLRTALQELYYAGRGRAPIADKIEIFLKCYGQPADKV